MSAAVYVVGWTLVHVFWQGALIAAAAAFALRASARSSASVRYFIACSAMALMGAAALVTAGAITGAGMPEYVAHAGAATLPNGVMPTGGLRVNLLWWAPVRSGRYSVIERIFPWMVPLWLGGVALLLARTSLGWWRVQRLHALALSTVSSRWQPVAQALASRLAVHRLLRVVELAAVDVPLMIGYLRPVIVLPVAALSHLTPAQVEAILGHELAHIRRHDYLVNLLQTLVESTLFYHPAVWWISARIREEREHCCDDEAVALSGDRVVYAGALAEIETCRRTRWRLAPAASDGSLLRRIRRVLHVETDADRSAPPVSAVLAVLAILAATVWRLEAQAPPAAMKFEVASVKPNDSPDLRGASLRIQPGGRFVATNMPLNVLIAHAYGLLPSQLSGPKWIAEAQFDINAKAEREFAPGRPGELAEPQLMLQTLLSERFALVMHHENRELPVYALKPVRDDGQLGPKLTRSAAECKTVGGEVGSASGFEKGACGIQLLPGQLKATGVPLDAIIVPLSQFTRRVVLNRTNLGGGFDIDLRWTPELPRRLTESANRSLRLNGVEIDLDGPSLFTALREQLGLKLEPAREPVDVLVVDQVKRPDAD